MGSCCSTPSVEDDIDRRLAPAPPPTQAQDLSSSPAPRPAFELQHVNVSAPSTNTAARQSPGPQEFPRMSFSAASHAPRNSQSSSDPTHRDSHEVGSTISEVPRPRRRGEDSVDSSELRQSIFRAFSGEPAPVDEDRRGRSMELRLRDRPRDHARARRSAVRRPRSAASGNESTDTRRGR